MAETVHLFLKADGKDIKGESTQTSLGRESSIECLYYEQEGIVPREAGTAAGTNRREFTKMVIRKRIDKASPLLMKAMLEHTKVEGDFKFFRPSPAGDGTTEQFYTVSIEDGRISGVRQFSPDAHEPSTSTVPPLEEVAFVFKNISWTITDGGISHKDEWAKNR